MASEDMTERPRGRLRALWQFFSRPSSKFAVGTLTILGIIVGVLGWGAFNWSLELTNTEAFCISCHEMRNFVYREYKETIHYRNRTGVTATCPDCHVPKEWIYKVRRKVFAVNELYHKAMGSVDTAKKFDDKRLELATTVWDSMKATNSRECRNCHTLQSMERAKQGALSQQRHERAETEGKTCINCHKGIAHQIQNKTCLGCHGDILDVETRSKKVANLHLRHLISKKVEYKGENRDCLTCHEMVNPAGKAAQKLPAKEGWFDQGGVYHPNTLLPPEGVWKRLIVRPENVTNDTTIAETLRQSDPHTFKPTLKRFVCAQCHGPDSKLKTFYGARDAVPGTGAK